MATRIIDRGSGDLFTIVDDPWRIVERLVTRLVALDALPKKQADELHAKIASRCFDLVVAGQFKRGKTSLINALIGAELLPVAVVPLTSVVTVVSHGAEVTSTIVFENDETRQIAPGELASYVTERGNPGNVKHVREAHVTCPSSWLAAGIRLIDTPGVGSIYQGNTDVANRYVPKADAVLFVLSVDQPLGAAECEFLARVRAHAERIFFLLNKADLLSEAELAESVAFTHEALTAALGSEPALYPVSARRALQEHDHAPDSGPVAARMRRFLDALGAFLRRDKDATLITSVARKLMRYAAAARLALEIEVRARGETIESLSAKAARFQEKKAELLALRYELDALAGADAARSLQRPLEQALGACKAQLSALVTARIDELALARRGAAPRALRAALETAIVDSIRDGFDTWQVASADAADRRFAAFCARHFERVDGIVDALYGFAAELFSVPYSPPSADGVHIAAPEFHYKFWSEHTTLSILGSAIPLVLPARLGRRLIERRARRDALDLVEMQSGRLRHALGQRTDDALRAFRRAAHARIDAAICAIEAALDQAVTLRASSEADAQSRAAAVRVRLGDLDRIDADLRRLAEPFPPPPAPIVRDNTLGELPA